MTDLGLLMFIGNICEDIMYELKNTYCKSDVAIIGRMANDWEHAKIKLQVNIRK